jgi:dihydroxy-acid dehydratase
VSPKGHSVRRIPPTFRGYGYDALVGLAGCDKSLPGIMMAIGRLNVPSIFIYGGSILPGTFKGKPVTVQDVFEARSAGTPWQHVRR